MVRSIFLARLLVTVGLLITAAFGARAASPDNTLYMDLKDGRVVIELRPDLAPKHVQRIKKLVKEGFYDGLTFHRVITANSQFFICLEDASHLNGNYTVWGQVTEGMQLIDRIKKGAGASGQVFNPDKILKMQLASDAR